jgi:hypothetical protein
MHSDDRATAAFPIKKDMAEKVVFGSRVEGGWGK